MKKTIITTSFLILVACAPLPKREEVEQTSNLSKRNQYFADYCNSNSAAKLGNRPRLRSGELARMTEKQMDARIQAHIIAQSKYIDDIEEALFQTRRQNEICH